MNTELRFIHFFIAEHSWTDFRLIMLNHIINNSDDFSYPFPPNLSYHQGIMPTERDLLPGQKQMFADIATKEKARKSMGISGGINGTGGGNPSFSRRPQSQRVVSSSEAPITTRPLSQPIDDNMVSSLWVIAWPLTCIKQSLFATHIKFLSYTCSRVNDTYNIFSCCKLGSLLEKAIIFFIH